MLGNGSVQTRQIAYSSNQIGPVIIRVVYSCFDLACLTSPLILLSVRRSVECRLDQMGTSLPAYFSGNHTLIVAGWGTAGTVPGRRL